MTAVHAAAATGFEAAADAYARGRPDYPAALDEWLRGTLGLAPGKSVVDLGAGTGKFTPKLIATGASVTAIEPVTAMRARLAHDLPNVTALDGTATAIPLPDTSADAVICAQAFHWFATREALAEIHRVLKPGGTLGLVWNMRDLTVPWVARVEAIIAPYEGDTPRFTSGAWRRMFPARGFSSLEKVSFPHGHTGPAEAVIVDRQLSVSFIASLPPAERETIAARLRYLIADEPELAGRAEVTFPYVTHAYATRKALGLHRTCGEPRHDVALCEQEHRDRRHDGDRHIGQNLRPVGRVQALELHQPERPREVVRIVEHHERQQVVVPASDEADDRHRR